MLRYMVAGVWLQHGSVGGQAGLGAVMGKHSVLLLLGVLTGVPTFSLKSPSLSTGFTAQELRAGKTTGATRQT
jgi:hypothetical protein